MPSPTLTTEQVNAAMVMIVSHWPGQSLADSVRDTWRRKLATLHQGEFTPALDAWLAGPSGRYRPDVGAFMDVVIGLRAEVHHESAYDATQRMLADMRAVGRPTPDEFRRGIESCRSILRPVEAS